MANKFKLKIDGKVKYSNGEQAAFKALSDKPRSSTVIIDKVYSNTTNEPYNSRKIIIGVLKSLRAKMLANKEPFKLLSTERSGPNPMSFWLEGK